MAASGKGLTYVACANPGDAHVTVELLGNSGLAAVALGNLRDLASAIGMDAGCLVLVEDALIEEDIPALRQALDSLPAWLDIPLLVVARSVGGLVGVFASVFPDSGNVTFLERPLNPHTLVSAVRVALRATARQHEVGRLLQERERAVALRDEFLAMLAHELRNPLASMRNATHMLGMLELDDPRAVKSTQILDRQVSHLARMVEDLMDVERLERSKMVLQQELASLHRVVASAVESSLPLAQARGHRITVRYGATDPLVHVDIVRIEQVLCNLVNNAIKFSPQPGEIRVETSAGTGRAFVTVQDEGAGFEASVGEQLFLPFLQLGQSIARSAGGLGIGLTIVRRLVELHGGTVTATSDGPGRGATFTVSLPIAALDAKAPVAPRLASHRQVRRIVVVDDNPDIRDSMEQLLTSWGHEVSVAADGTSGLEEVLRRRPYIALVDIGLPGMNGYDVAREVRRQAGRDIRLIAVTGYGQPSDKTLAQEAGFDAHLLKPISLDALDKLLC